MSSLPPVPTDRRDFEEYVVNLRSRGATVAEVIDALTAIMRSELTLREKDRRAAVILASASLDAAAAEEAAKHVAASGSPLPQVLIRAQQYAPATHGEPPPTPRDEAPVALPTTPSNRAEREERASVLLLGNATEHHANIALLENKKIGFSRIDDPAGLEKVSGDPFCGIVVGASWWRNWPAEEHERELTRVLATSTVPWMRLDVSSLDSSVATRLTEVVRRVFGADRSHAMLCHGRGCDITSPDIGSIQRIEEVLSAAESVGFHPGDLSAEEALLLRAAMIEHVRQTRGVLPVLERMAMRFIPGGLAARVAIASPDDRGMPLVVKFGDLAQMREEVQRYAVVARWEGGGVTPRLHFHGSAALLLVPLVDDGEGGAARTLGDEVQEVVYDDLRPVRNEPLLTKTKSCISRAFARIAKLNATPFVGGHPRNLAEINAKSLSRHAIAAGKADVRTALTKAGARVGKFDGRATVHGDLHLGNVLVRGDTAAFIDFGQAGAGHPVQDIVKLDTQIWFRAFRLTEEVARLAELLREAIAGKPVDVLLRTFASLALFESNKLCIHAHVVARTEALEVMYRYGGGSADVAAMYVVCAANEILASPPSTPIARAFISAFADEL